tara:strand:+ start:1703 stop:2113 length:411 start_codon:yes stop_codon:yes gene_type:complete
MARSMKNTDRKEKKLLKTRAALVRAALEAGQISRKDICNATGLQMHELANLFTQDREVYGEYVVRRKTISDIASDNILDIVNDPTHPQHFQASKYILSTYKSDLDDVLESQTESEMNINVGGESGASPINITFGKK